jgi:hypothetical protein
MIINDRYSPTNNHVTEHDLAENVRQRSQTCLTQKTYDNVRKNCLQDAL